MSRSIIPTPANNPFTRPFLTMPITELASKLFNPKHEYRPNHLAVSKRIRGILHGKTVFDTTHSLLVWEHKWFPQYWIPQSDFTSDADITTTADPPTSGIQPSTSTLTVTHPSSKTSKSITTLQVPSTFASPLAGYVKINFDALDQWLEECSQIIYHPRDPYHRIDCLPSDRSVVVKLHDGVVLADTTKKGGVMSLWETNFPGRWYLPRTAVNWELLVESDTKTGCPYKGEASYYHAVIDGKEEKDVVWWYKAPLLESAPIVGMLCFYPDKVDMWVDGELQEKVGMPHAKAKDEEARRNDVHNGQ